MHDLTIGFIGAGNMAQAIIGGLINTGTVAENIHIHEPNEAMASQLAETLNINVASSNQALANLCDVVVLAVKPQVMQSVLSGLDFSDAPAGAFLMSVAAGLPIALMQKWLGQAAPFVRVMPNTPALVGAGVSGLFASAQTTEAQRQSAESVMRAVGSVVWVENEVLIDSVTAVSGSGPAYFFYLMEALEKAGVENGLSIDQAKLLSLETAFGAAKLALESDADAAELRRRVTSPGGTTQAAISVFESENMTQTVRDAVDAAANRARELAEQMDV